MSILIDVRSLVALAVLAAVPAGAHQVRTGHEAMLVEPEPEMAIVPAGSFVMGITDEELADLILACEREYGSEIVGRCRQDPQGLRNSRSGEARLVHTSAYAIDRYETTTREYRRCVEAGACDPVPLVTGDTRFIRDEWPVVNVTWDDAVRYCRWRGKRLPTEAEWERAARGSDGRRWPWGNVDVLDRANLGAVEPEELRGYDNFSPAGAADAGDGSKTLVPPGTYRFGRSPHGAYDMAGNVSEWVADWASEQGYAGFSTFDPTGPSSGTRRAVRGAGFLHPRLFGRTYLRDSVPPRSRSSTRGFRCARSIE